MSHYKPSTWQILRIDFLLRLLSIGTFVVPMGYILTLITTAKGYSNTYAEAIWFFLIFIVLLGLTWIRSRWCIQIVRNLFANGVEVVGIIDRVKKGRVVGIRCKYVYGEKSFTYSEDLNISRRTYILEAGGHVVLLVDPTNPRRAKIRNLYFSRSDYEETLGEFNQLLHSPALDAKGESSSSSTDNRS